MVKKTDLELVNGKIIPASSVKNSDLALRCEKTRSLKLLKPLFLLFFVVMTLGLSANNLYSQTKELSKKELRNKRKAEEQKASESIIAQKIESRNFTYIAEEIISTGKARYSNIKLNSLWLVTVTNKMFSCTLPIYGASSFNGSPTLTRGLDIFSDDYKMETSTSKNGTIIVKIEVRDNKQSTQYYFDFRIPSNGRFATLIVSSNFKTPVRYSGRVDIR